MAKTRNVAVGQPYNRLVPLNRLRHVLICLFLIHHSATIISPHQCHHHHSYHPWPITPSFFHSSLRTFLFIVWHSADELHGSLDFLCRRFSFSFSASLVL